MIINKVPMNRIMRKRYKTNWKDFKHVRIAKISLS